MKGVIEEFLLTSVLVATMMAHGEVVIGLSEPGVNPGAGLVAVLGVRLREMWKLADRVSGESAAQEAAVLVGKRVARGLTLPVLETIRTDVFSVSAPSGQ